MWGVKVYNMDMSDRFRINRKFEINQGEPKKFEVHREEVPDETPISEIEQIAEGGLSVSKKEDLVQLVEAPLLQACEELYDKGIKTIFSSANRQDIAMGHAYITIDFDSLNPANQELAGSLGEIYMTHGSVPVRAVNIEIPINEASTVGDIRRAAAEIVAQFHNQNPKV